MNANITITNNRIMSVSLSNVLVEKIADTIAIHDENNFEYYIKVNEIIRETHTEDEDSYDLMDGTQVTLSFT